MVYQYKDNCKRVVLHILVGADNSLVGLKVHNCSIISMKFSDLTTLVTQTHGREAIHHLTVSLSERQLIRNDADLVALEIIDKTGKESEFYEDYLLEIMKLYKAEDIYSCYRTTYAYQDGRISTEGFIYKVEYKHAVDFCPPRYHLGQWEKDYFPIWFDTQIQQLFVQRQNEKYANMLNVYDKSYLIGIAELEYIMLFSVLEMIFGSGNSEITYQISRGTALLLSNTADEMAQFHKEMKKLYNIRSKYVHSGVKISWDSLYKLREIVRKVLIKLVELGYHTSEKTFDELQNSILLGGFHSFSNIKKEE